MLIHVQLLVIPILLLMAAVFAAAEASLFSLSRTQLESLKDQRPQIYHRIRALLQRPDALLSTLIIGNECLNIMIATAVVTLLESQIGGEDEILVAILSVLTSAFLLLTFSEVLPKVLAFRLPAITASTLVYPASWAHFILTPFRKIFMGVSNGILKMARIQYAPPPAVSEKDFLTLVEVGAESGSLDRDEKEMIFNVFNFSDMTVSSVMTPWKDVFNISETLSISEVLNKVREKTFSRIPVISADQNRVVGILYTKALFRMLISSNAPPESVKENRQQMQQAIFPPYIVSTHKRVSKLFREFKLKKVHMALVVDEYGRQLGVVTLEDLLNAIFKTQHKQGEASE